MTQPIKIRDLYTKTDADVWIVQEIFEEPMITLLNPETKQTIRLKINSLEFKQYKKLVKESIPG